MRILITGGAGYIGSHAVRCLCAQGHHVTVVDHLENGHLGALPRGVALHRIDVRETSKLEKILADGTDRRGDALRRADLRRRIRRRTGAFTSRTTSGGPRAWCVPLAAAGVRRAVFSSTAAVYGESATVPIDENSPIAPANPYGESKAAAEHALREWAEASPDRALAILRYFNVAGAAEDGSLGEHHDPETHLIPNALRAALNGEPLEIFGDDYPTPDGTCVRDYIHVEDLVEAHSLVLDNLEDAECRVYNLGIGRGFSVREVLQSAEAVTGQRYTGDPRPSPSGRCARTPIRPESHRA